MRLFLFILFVFSLNAFAYQSEAPENASLKMLGIEDGETYKSPIKINFVIDNMKVVPAGQKEKYAGHHHLLINAKDDINLAASLSSKANSIPLALVKSKPTVKVFKSLSVFLKYLDAIAEIEPLSIPPLR